MTESILADKLSDKVIIEVLGKRFLIVYEEVGRRRYYSCFCSEGKD